MKFLDSNEDFPKSDSYQDDAQYGLEEEKESHSPNKKDEVIPEELNELTDEVILVLYVEFRE